MTNPYESPKTKAASKEKAKPKEKFPVFTVAFVGLMLLVILPLSIVSLRPGTVSPVDSIPWLGPALVVVPNMTVRVVIVVALVVSVCLVLAGAIKFTISKKWSRR